MFHKIKWHYISEKARSVVFEDLQLFNERRAKGVKDKDVLERLFNAYNEYVSYKFNLSHMSCGSCVSQVKNFFDNEYIKWQRKEN